MYIELENCPPLLQDAVIKWKEKLPVAKLIAVTRYESTPFKDKTITVIRYKAYLQAGLEFLIIATSETHGIKSLLDGDISTNWLNGGDISTIFDHADYVKDDLMRRLDDERIKSVETS